MAKVKKIEIKRSGKEHEHLGKDVNRSKVERLVDIMFSDAEVPAESMDKMRWWLADPDKEEEKSNALYEKFLEVFKFNPEPVLAPALWPDLARRLGMSETPVRIASDPLAAEQPAAQSVVAPQPESELPRRRISFRTTWLRVAAVLVPVALVLGTIWWAVDRRSHDTLVEISVPAGSTQTITLPDGSRVEADPGAVISYDSETFADHRLVTLAGEALFDVIDVTTPDGARVPFTVEADNLTVNVLGTIFRLDDDSGEGFEAAAVSLYRGSVEVAIEGDAEAEKLLVGERIKLNTLTGEHTTELIPASEMAEHGVMPLLRFDEATLGDLVLALEMNHGVRFDVAEGIDRNSGRYSADFEGIPLGQVLEMLSRIDTNLSFEIAGEKVNVRKK